MAPQPAVVDRFTDFVAIHRCHDMPGEWDVICHYGKNTQDHIGNKRFKVCIETHLKTYAGAESRTARSTIINDIIVEIRERSKQAGFVRYDAGRNLWYEVGDKIARDKVGQALRDLLRTTRNEAKRNKASDIEGSNKNHPLVFGKIDWLPFKEATQMAQLFMRNDVMPQQSGEESCQLKGTKAYQHATLKRESSEKRRNADSQFVQRVRSSDNGSCSPLGESARNQKRPKTNAFSTMYDGSELGTYPLVESGIGSIHADTTIDTADTLAEWFENDMR
eukprot:scaffold620_cov103-Cylindrotheca_fusiformis.AAC.4